MEVWANDREEHRRHPSFRTQQWAFTREWGFTCECSGFEQEWRIGIAGLREALPEVREMLQRLFRAGSMRGNKKAKRALRKSNGRAKALLHKYLTREQRWELRATKAFTVVGQDGRSYHVTEGSAGNVFLLENGEHTYRFCVVPNYKLTTLPTYDLMLAQKVLLENNLRLFLSTAVTTNLQTNARLETGLVLLDGGPELPRRVAADYEPIEIDEQDVDEPEAWVRARLEAATQGDPDGNADPTQRDEGQAPHAEPVAAE